MRLRFSEGDGLLNRHDLRCAVLALQDLPDDVFFCSDRGGSREAPTGIVLLSGNYAELAGCDPRLEVGTHFRVRRLAHSATHGIHEKGALIA